MGDTDTFPLLVLLILIASYPAHVFLHELGHACAVLATGKRPTIMLGLRAPMVRLEFERIGIWLHPLMIGGLCIYDPCGLTVAQVRRIAVAGPVASALFLAGFALAGYLMIESLLGWAFLAAFTIGAFFLLDEVTEAEDNGVLANDRALLDQLNKLPPDARF